MHIISNSILSIEQISGRRTWRTRSPTGALFFRNSASILEQFVKTEVYVFFSGRQPVFNARGCATNQELLAGKKNSILKPSCPDGQFCEWKNTMEGGIEKKDFNCKKRCLESNIIYFYQKDI